MAMMDMTGKMIALYGVNGIGKTTQAELLVGFLKSQGKEASWLKYPVYDLEPEGPFIYKYLRDREFRAAHELTTEELQAKYAKNRRDYEMELKRRLATGEWIVAEDYTGTGIAWGLTRGADLAYLEKINQGVYQPDLEILLAGERFDTAIEAGHQNETQDDKIRLCSDFHLFLEKRYGWERVDANRNREEISRDIIQRVIHRFPDKIQMSKSL